MFGYVNVLRDDLKVRDYMNFRAYYCGLCRAIGKSFSQTARLGLSYDMTFLAVLLSALSDSPSEYKTGPCLTHPLGKRCSVINDPAVDYAANASVILYYSKMKDDWHDEHSLTALLGIIAYAGSYKKASRNYPELSEKIKSLLDDLSSLEEQRSNDIDLAADCFAKITGELFSPDFTGENKRPAAWLGYNIGRWIYVIDAFSDMEKDFRKKSYNPFLIGFDGKDMESYKKQLAKNLSVSLTFTLENAVSGFDLMKIYKNGEILKNVLYLSLKTRQDEILGADSACCG
ncbi:MAG: hypothetical protein J6N52_02330 [Clostridia bacterium]|nr:hypothetical protein [Clostridia bacterium]